MPDFDGTGPSGKGPLTGRKRGKCRASSNEQSKREDSIQGRKFGFRRGRGNIGGRRRGGGQGNGQNRGG